MPPTLSEFLATQPEWLQLLAVEFPLFSTVHLEEDTLFVIGYCPDSLLVSEINPANDFEAAAASHVAVCLDCARKGRTHH